MCFGGRGIGKETGKKDIVDNKKMWIVNENPFYGKFYWMTCYAGVFILKVLEMWGYFFFEKYFKLSYDTAKKNFYYFCIGLWMLKF